MQLEPARRERFIHQVHVSYAASPVCRDGLIRTGSGSLDLLLHANIEHADGGVHRGKDLIGVDTTGAEAAPLVFPAVAGTERCPRHGTS